MQRPTISPDLSGQLAAELAAPAPFSDPEVTDPMTDSVEYGRPGLRVRVSLPDDLDGDDEFRAWMLRVNRAVTFAIEITTAELNDYPYREEFDAGYPATETARRAIRASW